ncbi:hypothetical protein PN441_05225 [Spirulina major CS-329]|uniref:hypothetical protein n=1 Tax=Spirulina TaxID=1154 RepID=UPI0023312555|nr:MULTISPECIES: hypothetical protein [Spirulina]MDB9496287.1 hypothetical protein [Spirulina subsalsa CS-330]MDB9502466.1 hypothetical protein [Spirulina major CS-329]
MLVPITREKFEQLVPAIATGAQYAAAWGSIQDIVRRVLISVIGMVALLLLNVLFQGGAGGLKFFLGIIAGLYWLWAPVYWASLRNSKYRRWKYSGFWRGRILDVFISEDLIREEETFNQRGELVIVENRERRINLDIGDRSGFRTLVQAPLRRSHKLLKPGQKVECLVFSNQADLSEIKEVSDLHIPSQNLWVGEYPCLRRDFFLSLSADLRRQAPPPPDRRRPPMRDRALRPRSRRDER